MDPLELQNFRPNGCSADSIATSLRLIAAARGRAAATIRKAEAQRKNALLAGSNADVRKAEEAVADARLDAERLQLLEGEIAPLLPAAEERERRIETEAKARRKDLVNKLAAHDGSFAERYRKVAAEMRELLDERRGILRAIAAHNLSVSGPTLAHLSINDERAQYDRFTAVANIPPTDDELAAQKETERRQHEAWQEAVREARAQPREPVPEPRQATVNGVALGRGGVVIHQPNVR